MEKINRETYLLKNKNLKIKFAFELSPCEKKTETVKNVTKDSISHLEEPKSARQLIIEKEDFTLVYTETQEGVLVDSEGKINADKILLEQFANGEKRKFYKHLLQTKYSEIENLVILTGAGSSVGIGTSKKGLTMAKLWDKAHDDVPEALKHLVKETGYSELDAENNFKTDIPKDLEALLSQAGMKNTVQPNAALKTAIDDLKKLIVNECTIEMNADAPHPEFLNKVALRPQKFPRVKVFTLNYDTLFEQAAAKERFTVIDGFTFSNPRIFNGKYFDYDIIETRHNRQDKKDSIISKLFYLFKMHGSLSWRKNIGEIEQADCNIKLEERVMIFPQNNKYEHSYEQPYFEMMARFQQALRTENTLLITVGFSFFDKHISSVIIESLKQNPSLNLITVSYEIIGQKEEYQKELHQIAEIQSRVTFIAETFKDFTVNYPENIAHQRFDLLDSLTEELKKIKSGNAKS